MKQEINGFLNFYKPHGMSSMHAVRIAKAIFNAKKAGHAGTLDPLAEGVLPIAFGKATKKIEDLMSTKKTYEFTITFGAQTTTDDLEGEITHTSDKRPTREAVEEIMLQFTGEIEQTPSAFSAVKINGISAYKLARQGKEVTIKSRRVTIHSLEMLTFSPDAVTMRAVVSKGTYIRSLGKDIGQALGCYGHITLLKRTEVGPFHAKESQSKKDLEALKHQGKLESLLIPF